MSRPREITLKNVADAAEKLLREDRKPTPTLVQHITGGSFLTVKDLFGQWQASRPAVGELERVAPELLRSLCEALRRSAELGRVEETQGREVAEENYKTLAGEMKEMVLERDDALDVVQIRTGERDLQMVTAAVHTKEIVLLSLQLDEQRTLRLRVEADLYMAVQREMAHADQVLAQDARLASAAKEIEQLGIRLRQEQGTSEGLIRELEIAMDANSAVTHRNQILDAKLGAAVEDGVATQRQLIALEKDLAVRHALEGAQRQRTRAGQKLKSRGKPLAVSAGRAVLLLRPVPKVALRLRRPLKRARKLDVGGGVTG